jgi:ADP-ribosylglycohydrolase
MLKLSQQQIDRARGVLVGQAVGDALGQPFEFGPQLPADYSIEMKSGSSFKLGEWTDDTDQAIAIALSMVHFEPASPAALQDFTKRLYEWLSQTKDVGIQTSMIMGGAGERTYLELLESSKTFVAENERSHGNGSLMRTSPVALGFLENPNGLAEAAIKYSQLTHAALECVEACVIWSYGIREAVLNGTYSGIETGIETLEQDRQSFWREIFDEAESKSPNDFPSNGWVIHAIQVAWSAIHQTQEFGDSQFKFAVEACIRAGNDTDTTAAICGALVGACRGDSNVPEDWSKQVWGWPKMTVEDLRKLSDTLINSNQSTTSLN